MPAHLLKIAIHPPMIGIKRRKAPYSASGKGTLKAAARGTGRAWAQANHTKA